MVHEWALAEAVISTVSRVARENRARRITKVYISVGELQSIDVDIFSHALEILKDREGLQVDEFLFEEEPAVFQCNRCGETWRLSELDEEAREAIHFVPEAAHLYISCPRCGSTDFKVVTGRGVYVKRVEVMV